MVIGIEAERANHPEKTGVEHYAKQLILHLAQIDRKNQYRLYLRSKAEPWFFSLPQNFEVRVMPFPKFWTQIRLSWELLLHPVDVLLVPASALPVIHPKKSICTIHDAAFIYYPEADTAFMRNFLNYSYQFIVKRAWKIIAISTATKRDLIEHYKCNPDKIAVIHHGFEPQPATFANVTKEVLAKLPEKYVLFVSTLQPRKNLPELIDAFRKFKEKHPEIPHKLVVFGKAGWKFEPILESIEKNKDIVIHLGHVSNEDRLGIYKKADAFINASLYEGFGMWILEAFDAGIPVAVSNVSSLPEIAGEAAVLFDPNSQEEMVKALEEIVLDDSKRGELVLKGKERLIDFSWEKCAQETLALIESNE